MGLKLSQSLLIGGYEGWGLDMEMTMTDSEGKSSRRPGSSTF